FVEWFCRVWFLSLLLLLVVFFFFFFFQAEDGIRDLTVTGVQTCALPIYRKPRTETGPYIGRPMPRFEDLRLVRGAGKYSDDISMPGQAYAVFVRSPHAHARVKHIDTADAKKMPGVIAVLTGADYIADGLKGALQRANPAGAIDIKVRAFDAAKRPVLEE